METSPLEVDDGRICVRVAHHLAPLIPPFLERRQHEVVRLRTALEQGDFYAIRVIGHNLISSSGSLGFDGLCGIARELEASAEACDGERIALQVEAIERYLSRLDVRHG